MMGHPVFLSSDGIRRKSLVTGTGTGREKSVSRKRWWGLDEVKDLSFGRSIVQSEVFYIYVNFFCFETGPRSRLWTLES